MSNFDIVLERLLQLEDGISRTYKYTIHVNILESFQVFPWLLRTDLIVDRVLPVLEARINAVCIKIFIIQIQ